MDFESFFLKATPYALHNNCISDFKYTVLSKIVCCSLTIICKRLCEFCLFRVLSFFIDWTVTLLETRSFFFCFSTTFFRWASVFCNFESLRNWRRNSATPIFTYRVTTSLNNCNTKRSASSSDGIISGTRRSPANNACHLPFILSFLLIIDRTCSTRSSPWIATLSLLSMLTLSCSKSRNHSNASSLIWTRVPFAYSFDKVVFSVSFTFDSYWTL